jgi:hypothetical protein
MALLHVNSATAQSCPLACNNNVQVSMDLDCEVEITPDMMLEGQGTDPGCNYTVDVLGSNDQPIPGSPVVTNLYMDQTLTVRVNLGLNSCWGLIKIEDKMPPVIDCLPDITVDCYDRQTFPLPPAVDNCTQVVDVTEIYNDLDDTACSGDTTACRTLRYRAEDASGNKSLVCERKIYYIKIGLDDVIFPPNKDDVEDPALECDNIPFWDINGDGYPQPEESGIPTTLDGFPVFPNNSICELNSTFSDQVLPICESSFKVIREWVILDWCTSLISRDFQIIKVVDKEAPIITCPIDLQDVQADPHACTGTWIVPPPVVIYDCSSTTYTVGYLLADNNGNAPPNGVYIDDNITETILPDGTVQYTISELPVGRTWVRYTVEDACGNVDRCFTEVDVVDNVPPVAVCDQFTVVTLTNSANTPGVASIFAHSFDDGSHDNCTDVTLDVRRLTSGCQSSQFRDRVNFCCPDVGRDIMVELRVKDANGLSNSCMVNVTVQDKSEPEIECPDDITIDCTDDIDDLSLTGTAVAIDNCGSPNVTYADSGNTNQCKVGTIRRTFTAQIGNTTKTCRQDIEVTNNNPFNGGDINWSGISDKTLSGCMDVDTDPSITGRPTWNSGSCSLIAASYTDKTFTLVDSVCFKILRTWTIIDWCQFDQNNPSYGGIYSRTQVIKLNNTTKPVFTDCADKVEDGFGPGCDGYISLTNDATDDCTPSDKLVLKYRIDLDSDGTYGPETTGKDASGTYPVGSHKIYWLVEDLCGNRTSCEYTFTIRDKKKPTPYCLSEITTVIMPSSEEIAIWAIDFDRGSFDNCPGDIKISFSSNTSHTSETFTCDDIGINLLEMWVTDASGNKDFCTVRVNIQSNGDACEGSRIGGYISTEDNKMVDDVAVALSNRTNPETLINNSIETGEYQFGGVTSDNEYEINATKEDNYMNGISTLDLVLIQRHILGIEEFTSPYKVIASDINNNEKVTASDLVELRKLILGIYQELPNNDSWRFVNEKAAIADASDPFPFEELIGFMYHGEHMMDNNFTAVKIGDVNNTAKSNVRDNTSDSRSNTTLSLTTKDVIFEANDLIRIPVTTKEEQDLLGFQFGMSYNDEVLEFVGLEARSIELSENNIGLSQIDNGIINTSWNTAESVRLESGDAMFDIVFKANAKGSLQGNLKVSQEGINPEAYKNVYEVMDVELDIRSLDQQLSQVELYQNTPNPFDNTTSIKFNLPKEGVATLKVVDITGRTMFQSSNIYSKGENIISLSVDDIAGSGVLYYMLEVDGQTSTRKMILIRD